MQIVEHDIPRRYRKDLLTPLELKIYDLVQEIEAMGADPLLTDAQQLILQAKEKIADYVEKQ